MNKNFVFDAYCTETEPQLPKKRKSPWEFSRYSHTVAEEHAKRKTTSIDHKISKKLRKSIDEEEDVEEREAPSSSDEEAEVSSNNEDEEEDEDIEHEQEQEEEEEEEEENADSEVFEQTENDGNDDHDDISRETGHWNGISDESDIDFTDGDNAPQLSNPKKDGNKDIVKTAGGGAPRRKKGSSGFFAPAEGASFNAKSFAELNLSRPLLKACEALGYEKPTPIQAACIPLALTGRDICGSAITGSGKTAAFGLPVLERLLFRPKRIPATRVLVLTPTRELAVQIQSMLEKLAQFTDIRCCLAVGGLSLKIQEAQLRSRPDIVVATPGRIIDHLHNSQSVGLEDLAVLIFDEADRLLDLGFSSAVEELIKLCPKRRQTMLFSATMTDGVDKLIKLSLTSPVRLSADPLTKRPSTLTEEVIKIRPSQEIKQEAILFSLCSRTFKNKVIIFSGTKQEAHRLKILFGLSGLKAAELHGNLTQAQRLDALEQFRKQEADFLIATDVAARGLDILGVETVINFACPRDITSYVHRVGRTARAGKVGCAITFVKEQDRRLLKLMAKRAGSRLLSRKVAEQSVVTWAKTIEEMEEDINAIIMEEREERAMRKAEMEAAKAQNMVEHADEIYARPKRTWFESEKDKKMLAKAAKLFKEKKEDNGGTLVTSAQEGEMLERKEKRRLDYEKNLPRRKRRKLQAAREMLEDDENLDNNQHSKNSSDRRSVKTLVEIGYRKAKAAKAIAKAHESGKFKGHAKKRAQMGNRRKDEMEAGFKNDVNFKKQRGATGSRIHLGRKKSKKSFKSKSRYQRRK